LQAQTVTNVASGFTIPLGLEIDSLGNLYVSNCADANAGIINKVSANGIVTALVLVLSSPAILVLDAFGNLYASIQAIACFYATITVKC